MVSSFRVEIRDTIDEMATHHKAVDEEKGDLDVEMKDSTVCTKDPEEGEKAEELEEITLNLPSS